MTSQFTGLVVEDEWLLRMELAEELNAAGWQTREAGSGEEALALIARLQAQGSRMDFLVTDIRLGGAADGWDVAEACRKAWPEIPVIYVSANPIAEKRRMENSIFLGKPVDVDSLLRNCRALLTDRT